MFKFLFTAVLISITKQRNNISGVLPVHDDSVVAAVRGDLRPRHHHHPQHDGCHGEVPRDAQLGQGVHDAGTSWRTSREFNTELHNFTQLILQAFSAAL